MKEPLAFRMRPKCLNDIIGQEHLLKEDSFLKNSVLTKQCFSIIFYGPPGSGKTSLAEAYSHDLGLHIIKLNGTILSKKDIDSAINEAHLFSPTVIIIDEIHRLNKEKQDYLLPFLENGLFYLIGATTANPYLYINKAIRSRCSLLEVKPLTIENIKEGINRAILSPQGLNNEFKVEDKAIDLIAEISGGDLRYALNILETCSVSNYKSKVITYDFINNNYKNNFSSDNNDDNHYDAVSALQKSIRGSDVNAALYYLARLCAVNDLPSIERRLSIIAYEDVGLANPAAVDRVRNALETARDVGFPEAIIPLGFVVCDLALSPKSRASVDAIEETYDYVIKHDLPIPDYLKYTPVGLKDEEKYPYDRPDLWEKIQYLPEIIKDMEFYKPKGLSKYEKGLNDNYSRLKSTKRTNDIKNLKKIKQ